MKCDAATPLYSLIHTQSIEYRVQEREKERERERERGRERRVSSRSGSTFVL